MRKKKEKQEDDVKEEEKVNIKKVLFRLNCLMAYQFLVGYSMQAFDYNFNYFKGSIPSFFKNIFHLFIIICLHTVV